MSRKILKKEATSEISLSLPEYLELSNSPSESKGLKPLELPELAGLMPASSGTDLNPAGNRIPDPQNRASSIIADAEARGKEIEEEALETAMMTFAEKLQVAVGAETAELREQFAMSLDKFAALENQIKERVEKDLVELALAVAKKVIDREIKTDRTIVLDLLNNALAKLQERSLAEVHLNPEDVTYVEENRPGIKFRGTLELVSDTSISIGGCLIHTDNGDIDGRINSQFDEISHGLLEE
ncbi:MAG: hypothetical protein HKN33_01100 [Pyrinomonadaceae bacterium]|nr:hypothetical protein [Pyrinomonadaceae bacterium]